MSKFGTSQSVPRKEDVRFLTGGRYMEEAAPADAAHAVFLRSPVAHARIAALDVAEAAAAPGVLAVYGPPTSTGGLGTRWTSHGEEPRRLARRRAAAADPRRRPRALRGRGDRDGGGGDPAAATDAAELIVSTSRTCRCTWRPPRAGRLCIPRRRATSAYDWAFGDEAAVGRRSRRRRTPRGWSSSTTG